MPVRWPTARVEQTTAVILGLSLIPLAMLIARGSRNLCVQGEVVWQAAMYSVQGRYMVVQVVCMPKEGPFVLRYAELPPITGEGEGWDARLPEETRPATPYKAPDADQDPDFGWYYWTEKFETRASAIEAARGRRWET